MSAPTPTLATKERLFVTEDGRSVAFTFAIVSSLFLLWGFCNGMIDVMDKHFQEELHLTLSQSAWVQFAHYLGYFLMAMPAGWLASRLGYKGGIIAGLLMVAVGGFWFIPASNIAQFWAFLLGVCVIASGLTFLETVANPYTTVLGHPRYAATRINLAQSCNGVGWILGPIAGAIFFYGKDEAGRSTGSETLWIPYAGVGVLVLLLAVLFFFAPVPEIRTRDEYHLDDENGNQQGNRARKLNRPLVFCLLWLNVAVLVGVIGMIFWLVVTGLVARLNLTAEVVRLAEALPRPAALELTPEHAVSLLLFWGAVGLLALGAVVLVPLVARISTHSIWSHPHFSGAVLAQFFYVAAQAGIFSFLINYMTSEPPAIPDWWVNSWTRDWFEISPRDGLLRISNQTASVLASVGFVCFLTGRFTGAWLLKRFSAHMVLGLYGLLNVVACALVFLKLGWFSAVCVFASYFLMSIMFPTIFALGIHGLGARAKKASAFIVMAIMGGAILPKLMGFVADTYDMSRGFIVPLACFGVVALYGWFWPRLSQADSLHGVSTTKGH